MENKDLKNQKQKVIIVGASSGIGLSTAKLLLEKGYDVINISRSDAEGIRTINADASRQESLKEAINQAAEGNLDALIYSAGCSMASPIEYADPRDYRYLFEVNFFGILEAMQAAIPLLKNKGGKIILISSMGGTLPIAFDSFYSASKAAVDILAEAANIELKPYNIKVTSIKPGGVATEFTYKRNIYGEELSKEYTEKQKKAVASLAKKEQNGLTPQKVAETIYYVLTTPNPPSKISVGLINKTFSAAAKILPFRLVEMVNSTLYDQ